MSEPPNVSILIERRPAVEGEDAGAMQGVADDGPLFFFFILIFYNGFLDNSIFDPDDERHSRA